jgi:hypothetical protein
VVTVATVAKASHKTAENGRDIFQRAALNIKIRHNVGD